MKIIDVPQLIIEYINLATKPSNWLPPEPVGKKLLPVLKLEDDMLPKVLMKFVNDTAGRMQAAPEYVAVPLVVALGSIIGTGCGVRPKLNDDWTLVPNVWGALVGPPTTKKSPALTSAIQPIYHLDRDAQGDFQLAMNGFLVEQMTKDLKAQALKKKSAAAKNVMTDDEIKELAGYGLKGQEPKCKRYYSNDATIEALGEILSANPRGVLVVNDELTGWLKTLEKPGREDSRSAFLTAWNGSSPQRVDRVQRGNLYISRFCVSILGGIQPDMLQAYLEEAQQENRNDGLVQRLQLGVYPDPIQIDSINDKSPDSKIETRIKEIFEELAYRLPNTLPKSDSAEGLPYFRFEKVKAYPVFMEWLYSLTLLAAAEDNTVMAEHLGKYAKLVPSLSLIFHLVRIVESDIQPGTPIDIKSLEMALKWARFLESHARRIYAVGLSTKVVAANALSDKLKAGLLKDGFKPRGVVQKGWSKLSTTESVNEALRELEEANWVRKVKSERTGGIGRPSSTSYEINPAILELEGAATLPTKPTKRQRRK